MAGGVHMSPTLEPIHRLAQGVRKHGPALLAGMPDPHDELMSLVWGPRFDREHALGLVARQPWKPDGKQPTRHPKRPSIPQEFLICS